MNRYMVGIAMAILLASPQALAGQAKARIEYRGGRVGASVAIRNLPVRVTSRGPTARGWIAADWGPIRIRVGSQRPSWNGRILQRQELRFLLGKETVKGIERHAKRMRIRGRTEGRWFRGDRATRILEISVGRIPVAELYDYGNDGRIDELYLTDPRRQGRFEDRGYGRRGEWDGIWDD